MTATGLPIPGATLSFSSDNGGTFSTSNRLPEWNLPSNIHSAKLLHYIKLHYYGKRGQNWILKRPNRHASCRFACNNANSNTDPNANPHTNTDPNPTPTPTPTPTSSTTPTPTPTPTANTGSITLLVEDAHNNPLSDALVSSTVQPSGMASLINVTDSSGYVTFKNAVAGSYTFKLVKVGYPTTNATIDFTGQSLTKSVNFVGANTSQVGGTSIMLVIIILVVAIAAGAGTFLLTLSHGQTSIKKKIKELQRQLEPKK